MLVRPPGGARTPVLGRSVRTLPQFWLEPVAKAFDDTPPAFGRVALQATEELAVGDG
jgi:hypothetical protein